MSAFFLKLLWDMMSTVLTFWWTFSIEETAAAATVALRGEIATTDQHQRAYIERCPFGVVFGMVRILDNAYTELVLTPL